MEKVEKELTFWQQKMQETVGKVLDDESISGLQKVIFMFMDEAEKINASLELQKDQFASLKTQTALLQQERAELKKEIRKEMFQNKETEIACNKVERRSHALKEFLSLNSAPVVDIRVGEPNKVSNVSLFDRPLKAKLGSVRDHVMHLFATEMPREELEA